jgi:hypothetical protein
MVCGICEIESIAKIFIMEEIFNFPKTFFLLPQSTSGREKESSRFTARYLLSLMALAGIIGELRLLH